jgi:hypothetical protein
MIWTGNPNWKLDNNFHSSTYQKIYILRASADRITTPPPHVILHGASKKNAIITLYYYQRNRDMAGSNTTSGLLMSIFESWDFNNLEVACVR